MAISVASVGALAVQGFATPATVPLPAGYVSGDFLVCISVARCIGTATISGTWTQHSLDDLANFNILISYQVADGSEVAPVITPANMTSGQKHMHRIIAFRGVDTSNPWGTDGAAVQNGNQANIGPITAIATPSAATGAILVLGARISIWTTVDVLSGDGLTWSEIFEDADVTIGNALGVVLDFAAYSGGGPTVTAKTFTVTGGVTDVGAGKMLALQSAPDVSVVGVGTLADQDWQNSTQPNLPAGIAAGDLLVCISVGRTVGGTVTSTWQTGLITDYPGFYQLISYKVAQGGGVDTPPTITPVGMVTPQTHVSVIIALRGVNNTNPFPLVQGAMSNNASAANIGPIAAVQPTPQKGIVLVIGNKLAVWTSVALLTGDSVTWVELIEAFTTLNNDQGLVIDCTIWNNGPPTLTDKTFVVTGGVNNIGGGQMVVLTGDEVSTNPLDISHVYKPFHIRPRPRPRVMARFYPGTDIDPDLSGDFDCSRPFRRPAFRYRFRGIIMPQGYPARDPDADISGDFYTVKVIPIFRPKPTRRVIPQSDVFFEANVSNEGDFDPNSHIIPPSIFRFGMRYFPFVRANPNEEVDVDLSGDTDMRPIFGPVQRRSRTILYQLLTPTSEIDSELQLSLIQLMDPFNYRSSIGPSLILDYVCLMDPFTLLQFVETWNKLKPDPDTWTPLTF